MAKIGRPSKFDGINLEQVKKLVHRGWTDLQMAEFFEVDETTWHRWKGKHPEFCQSLKDWKVEADSEVERSLFEKAKGFYKQVDGEEKYFPPDSTACIFWLKNRKKEEWRDKVDVGVGGIKDEPLKWEIEIVKD